MSPSQIHLVDLSSIYLPSYPLKFWHSEWLTPKTCGGRWCLKESFWVKAQLFCLDNLLKQGRIKYLHCISHLRSSALLILVFPVLFNFSSFLLKTLSFFYWIYLSCFLNWCWEAFIVMILHTLAQCFGWKSIIWFHEIKYIKLEGTWLATGKLWGKGCYFSSIQRHFSNI